MIVYCISGLGADERVFARLNLQADLRHIRWLKPAVGEPVKGYCKRLAEQIDASRPFALLGVSFGGVIARELAQLVPAKAVIIISSLSSRNQMPLLGRLPFLAHLPYLLPEIALVPPLRPMCWLFGIKYPEERQLLKRILEDTDLDFLRWALGILLRKQDFPGIPSKQLHIHGKADRLIPCPDDPQVVKVAGGSHFMIYSRAADISVIIDRYLSGEFLN